MFLHYSEKCENSHIEIIAICQAMFLGNRSFGKDIWLASWLVVFLKSTKEIFSNDLVI